MIYNIYDDFGHMKTTIYMCGERIDEDGNVIIVPLSRNYKKDVYLKDILCSFKHDWLFKESKYGHNIKEVTFKARSYSHGSIEYNDIKMHMPGYTWNGVVKKEDRFDELNQEFYEVRCKRSTSNMELNGLVCIEFDDVESKEVPDLIQKAFKNFEHLVYAGRTLSNKLFCMHRANEKINTNNYILYFYELAVQYYEKLGIKADKACCDVARIRYMCDQLGSKANIQYCDFGPTDGIKIQYDKIFGEEKKQYIRRTSDYVPEKDDTIYNYDENKGFYYGHQKQHLHKIGELIIPIPSIEQVINTLVALGKTSNEIIELWKTKLRYYNYNTHSKDVSDHIRLSEKIAKDKREFTVGEFTYTFLLMFFPEIIGSKSLFLGNNEFLCDRYYETLLNSILTNNRILIHGDTGIGKTVFANKLGMDRDVIVVVPYIAHMKNYPQYNQIELKDNMDVVSNGVVIWDRFVKLYNKDLISKNSIIIVDESHKLFLDQTYRDAAISMNHILREIPNKICYISATPIKEIDVNKTYRFEKYRNTVRVNHLKIVPSKETKTINDSLILQAMLHLIYGNLNYYDHIFIASDRFAQKLYDNLYGRYDCQLIRASQKESKEFLQLMKHQLLKHKIIIGTCISYESLNFNNKDEKILTITDMTDRTTSHTITQIAGRVRFSYNQVYLIDLIKVIEKKNFKELEEYYNKIEEIKSKYNIYSKRHYVQSYATELEEVSEWYYENNNIDKIKEDLPQYIKWEDNEIVASSISNKSPLNEQTKKYIINHLETHDVEFNNVDILLNDDNYYYTSIFFNDDNFIMINEEEQSGYIIRENIREQQYAYSKLLSFIDYRKINKLIVDTHTMPKGLNGEILNIMDIIMLDEITYNKYISDLEDYLHTLYDVYFYNLDRRIKEIKKIREKYIKCKNEQEYTMYNNIFDCMMIELKQKFDRKSKQKTKKIKDLVTNEIYDSVCECAKAINHNRTYISKHKNRFIPVD